MNTINVKKNSIYKFTDSKSVTTIEGDEKDGCKPKLDDLYWKIRLNKYEGRNFILFGDEPDFDDEDAMAFRIANIWQEGLVLQGRSYITSDDFASVELHFVRIK